MAQLEDLKMPDPQVFPICSLCSAPYILRRGFNMSEGGKSTWAWFRDCKHKSSEPKLFDARRGKPMARPRVPKAVKAVEKAAAAAGVKLKPLGVRRG